MPLPSEFNPQDRAVRTPSGLLIEFKGKPLHDYYIDGEQFPSTTEITKMIGGPGGLPWWGMTVGVGGLQDLHERYGADRVFNEPFELHNDVHHRLLPNVPYKEPEDAQAAIVSLLTLTKQTVNHIRDKAGDRGTDVHVAAARWAEHGEEPDPLAYPEEQMGYVRALHKWLTEYDPQVLANEQIVGSKVYGYAGTLDLRCKIKGRTGIVDYKTSSSIRHPQFDYQLAGYELASRECGYGETDFRAIVRLDKDGSFEWYESETQPHRFLDALGVYYEDKRIEEAKKAAKKARKTRA
jgi:hypothetical protein